MERLVENSTATILLNRPAKKDVFVIALLGSRAERAFASAEQGSCQLVGRRGHTHRRERRLPQKPLVYKPAGTAACQLSFGHNLSIIVELR